MNSPVKKEYITQRFGENPDIYSQYGLLGHNGIDFRAFKPDGTRAYTGGVSEVFAPHGGTIVESQFNSGYGNYVKIENQIEGSVLGHFSELSRLPVGSEVVTGDFIGFQGNTGNSTGIHLHWGYYKKPRNRNNGYAGYINQEGLYQPFGSKDFMEELLRFLGTENTDVAIAKLTEHLGQKDGKCEWGDPTNGGGGFLGSERRIVEKQKETIKALEEELDNPITPPDELDFGIETGARVKYDINGKVLSFEKTYRPRES